MHKVLALLDEVATEMERRDERLSLAVDYVSEQLARGGDYRESVLAAVLDDVAQEMERRGDTALASRLDEAAERLAARNVSVDSTLVDAADPILAAVRRYGAEQVSIRGSVVDIDIKREGVETRASLSFASRDTQGNPRLRIAFQCGDDQMIRWATIPQVHADTLAEVVAQVFATGQDVGEKSEATRTCVTAGVSTSFKPGEIWKHNRTKGIWFAPLSVLKNGGVKGLEINMSASNWKAKNSSVPDNYFSFWDVDRSPEDSILELFQDHPKYEG